MSESSTRPPWGILGGLGPLASAAFLQSVYEQYRGTPEQEMPVCLMISDPTFPDRTTRLLQGDYEELTERTEEALERLVALGAQRLFIACVTIHAVLPRVRQSLRSRVTSLLEVVAEELRARRRPHLLACTLGTYRLGLFQSIDPEAARYLVLPSPEDQERIHRMIYEIKAGEPPAGPLELLRELLDRYGADAFVAGCTELHLLTRRLDPDGGLSFVDPLDLVARRYLGPAAS